MAPRIPVYTQQVGTPRNLGPGPTGNLPGLDGGAGSLSQLGEAVSRTAIGIADIQKRKEEEDAAAWSAEQLSKARLDWTQQQIEREQNAPAGAKDYAGTLSKDFDAYADGVIKTAPTESARNYLRQRFTDMKSGVIGRGMEFEARSRLNDRLTKVDASIDNARIAVDLDPSQYQSALAENLATLSALDISEQSKRDIASKAQQALSFASVSARLRNDPYGVRQQLGSEDAGGALDIRALNADNRLRLRNQAESEIKQREAEAKQAAAISRAELAYRSQDAVSAYMQGLPVENAPTAGEYVAAYGAEKGQQLYSALTRAQQFGVDVQEFATLPIDERKAWLEQRQPGAQGVVAGEGFAEQTQLYGSLIKNAQALNKKLIDDGAGYAIKYAPEVGNAWQQVLSVSDPADAPATYQAYAEAARGEQARLGVPRPSILPATYVNQITSAFKDPNNAGARQLQLVDELKTNWGQHYGDVMRQLYPSLPDSVKVIASGVDKDTATILSTIAPVETKTLKAAIPSADSTALTNALQASMADFNRTFAAQGQGGLTTFNSIYNEAQRGALFMMANGKSPDEAAEDMASRLQANYQVDGTLRVPTDWDMDTVQAGAQVAISSLAQDDIALSEIKGISGEFSEVRFRALMDSGYLVTNSNEDGAYLFVNGGAVLRADGRPLEFKFDDLLGRAAEKPPKSLVDQLPPRVR